MSEAAIGRRQLTISLYEQVLQTGPDAVICVDSAGVILLVNRQTEALFGYRPRDVGRPALPSPGP